LYKYFFLTKNINKQDLLLKQNLRTTGHVYRDSYLFTKDTKNSLKQESSEIDNSKNNLTSLDEAFFTRLFMSKTGFKKPFISEITNLWTLFDINFLKKEKIYTKLKYSRVPQYDIVSGGSAALLSGFLGFLISEKFGIEMVDSGDFYYLFMYLVFFSFSFRPFLRIMFEKNQDYSAISFKVFFVFYKTLVLLLFKGFKNVCIFLSSYVNFLNVH
jgi:hypothetical protein